jgi:hypothetical protein
MFSQGSCSVRIRRFYSHLCYSVRFRRPGLTLVSTCVKLPAYDSLYAAPSCCLALEDSGLPCLTAGTMPSANSCTHLGSRALARASDTSQSVQASRGKPHFFQSVAPDLPRSPPYDYWVSRFIGRLPRFPSLLSGFCASQRTFVSGFLQISGHPEHPCLQL